MTNYRMTAILLIMSLACLVPRARADELHRTTRVTVKEPIRVQECPHGLESHGGTGQYR